MPSHERRSFASCAHLHARVMLSRVASGVLVACLLSAGGACAAARDEDGGGRTTSQGRFLDVGGLFPFSGPAAEHGWGVVPAAMLALAHVNENPDILGSHTLRMAQYDTQVGD